jgi:hypothetical protein
MVLSQFSAIFTDFRRKKWRFSQTTQVMIEFVHNLAQSKTAIFAKIFLKS